MKRYFARILHNTGRQQLWRYEKDTALAEVYVLSLEAQSDQEALSIIWVLFNADSAPHYRTITGPDWHYLSSHVTTYRGHCRICEGAIGQECENCDGTGFNPKGDPRRSLSVGDVVVFTVEVDVRAWTYEPIGYRQLTEVPPAQWRN